MAAETPLVHRPVRTGGLLLALASLQFAVVAVVAQWQSTGTSWSTARLATLASAPTPWGFTFDASLIVLGVVAFVGLLLAWSAFDGQPARGLGLLLLLVATGSAVAMGGLLLIGSPSSTLRWPEALGALGSALGLLTLSFAMRRQERWRASRAYTVVSGLVVLGSGGLFAAGQYLGAGPGGLERIALGVALLWAIVEGAHIALLHRFAPGLHVKVAAA